MTPLSLYAIGLGSALIVSCGAAWAGPGRACRAARVFPRSLWAGRVLAALAAAWVTAVVHQAHLGRFELVKTLPERLLPPLAALPLGPLSFLKDPVVWAGVVLFLMVIRYMDDLLAPRMLGGLLMLVANPVLAAARWHPASGRLALVLTAYGMAVAGMILMLSPFRFRKSVEWLCEAPWRVRLAGVAGLVWGAGLVVLAFVHY